MEKRVVWLVVGLWVVREGNQLSCEGKNGNKSKLHGTIKWECGIKNKKL